jgi:RimJ/RimL family protein N-acetyltransferase
MFDAPIGQAEIHCVDHGSSTCQIGVELLHSGRSRGVATECVRLLESQACVELGLGLVEIRCLEDNLASQRLASKCSFAQTAQVKNVMVFQKAATNA